VDISRYAGGKFVIGIARSHPDSAGQSDASTCKDFLSSCNYLKVGSPVSCQLANENGSEDWGFASSGYIAQEVTQPSVHSRIAVEPSKSGSVARLVIKELKTWVA
jgi:hypothetical protein